MTRTERIQYGAIRVVETRTLSDDYIARCDEFWQRAKALNRGGEAA